MEATYLKVKYTFPISEQECNPIETSLSPKAQGKTNNLIKWSFFGMLKSKFHYSVSALTKSYFERFLCETYGMVAMLIWRYFHITPHWGEKPH